MSRIPLTLTLPLFLVTALISWQILSLADAKSFSTAKPPPSAGPIAAGFYEAMNATLETGDSAELREILHSAFLDHSVDREEPATAADLENTLLALRSTFQNLRYAASMPLTQGSLVTSTVTLVGDHHGSIDNVLPVELAVPPSGYEVLKIEQGKVIERWSNMPGTIAPELLLSTGIDYVPGGISQRTPKLEVLTLERYVSVEFGPQAGGLVFVEAGEVRLSGDAATAKDRQDEQIQTGQALRLPVKAAFALANTGIGSSRVVMVTVPLFDRASEPAYAEPPHPLPAGVTRELRVSAPVLTASTGPVSISLRRIHIPPHVVIPNHVVAGTHVLLVVEGHLVVGADRAELTIAAGEVLSSGSSSEIVLGPGQSITGLPGDEVSFRPAGPSHTMILVLTFDPVTSDM